MSLAIGIGFMAMGVFSEHCVRRRPAHPRHAQCGNFRPASGGVTPPSVVAAAFGLILVAYLIYTNRAF